MKPLLAAIRFLTIAPVPGGWGTAEEDLARSVPWFPLVGLLLGAAAAGLAWVLSWTVPPMLAAAMLLVVLLSFSGCLHLDGLADTADGFLSSRPRERILEIMKDSHIGAMGVIAIACLLLLKFASLASLPAWLLWRAALLMPLAGRCAIVLHMALLPYVRPDGLAAVFYRRQPGRATVCWAVGVFALADFCLLGPVGMVVWVMCIMATGIFSAHVFRKIGGATGDTLGAVCELSEVVAVILLAIVPLGGGR